MPFPAAQVWFLNICHSKRLVVGHFRAASATCVWWCCLDHPKTGTLSLQLTRFLRTGTLVVSVHAVPTQSGCNKWSRCTCKRPCDQRLDASNCYGSAGSYACFHGVQWVLAAESGAGVPTEGLLISGWMAVVAMAALVLMLVAFAVYSRYFSPHSNYTLVVKGGALALTHVDESSWTLSVPK